jgi:Holliday junction resolvase RusA-like endonuclease
LEREPGKRNSDVNDIAHAAPARNSDIIVIELAGEPRGKGRPRFARRTGHAFTPQKTASYEACLRHEAALVMADRPPLEGALRVQVLAYFGVPQSWSAKKRAAALAGAIRPVKGPDADNICKMLDALNGVLWIDDSRIVSAVIEKHYSDRPRLRVEVFGLDGAALDIISKELRRV